MLQQILADMYIQPELLAELNEEQKQILFFKMREEQIRRWRERETQLEEEEAARVKVKKVWGKTVSWMKGLDDDVWVWVMGEHPEDKPYDQICDGVMAERAALQAQREAEKLRAKKEAELEKRFSGLYLEPEQVVLSEQEVQEEELKVLPISSLVLNTWFGSVLTWRLVLCQKLELEEWRKAEEELRRLEQERKQQIYISLKEVQGSKHTREEEDQEWQKTLQKSKAADVRRRSLAKQTIEDHRRRSVKALERGRVAAMTKAFGSTNPAPVPKPRNTSNTSSAISRKGGMRRSLSASSRDHIIRWFKEEQLPLRAGFQRDQSRIAPWFHGIISREQAEALLNEGEPGFFLVRVSERIFGYVLSYRSSEGIKHLLIDASENCYMLLGDQIRFSSLTELLEYHQVEPLSSSGVEEYLRSACGQKAAAADYTDLFT
ncbi:SH2 domain-containing protein 4A-like isoform X1 [Sinocyclocheilus anshuiensis]|uniref:SH2 domain-containing protein 4A-like n=1 Tax=Sinocyclocheilus anshuiensis TaxID=1608454 RepID=A0A671S5X4_9TELE|nr:PREDICTED: SH2 domain-containing protein 4A-like isoform X1 [Sinocyclocheilus anshuiensis]XP_016311860.1 PREDICTED: SH2 domain-containing protein 4A-like isoform X1 [Sinocyclocheilus anshuiensis]XP_016311861.1 PREDICTED: SH2 domain-containing protein 4A-like isoform X1 [Sinocyclocheilus anshuiensis]XP_016311862.1 PREDICTED: SH2 domain-containing protein 4A-like isoform X1 [Sinocyclocheilus anshuiensis]XP_016311863.1 PREDICTED: SH2 domain-containing protein 4A-like isoform X1 [Sinocyclocheilu